MRSETNQTVHLETTCSLTQEAFDRFAEVRGDHNPIHVDADYARTTAFGATVSHGMLLFSRLRALMEHACPGARLSQQELMFPAPSYADEALRLVLDGTIDAQGRVKVHTRVHKPDGRLGLDGSACLVPADAADEVPAAAADTVPKSNNTNTAAADLPQFAALRVGDTAHIRRVYNRADIADWAELAHMPTLPTTIPEPLLAALYSYLLGERLPGHGTNYLKQLLRFHALAEVDEPLRAEVRVTRLRADKALVNLDTHCHGADDRLLCSGQALVLFRC